MFCLRDTGDAAGEVLDEIERVPVASLKRFGRRLSLVLDRGRRKRCEFLFLEKKFKNKDGVYEQIFFRTPGAIRGHRTRGRPHLHGQADLLIAIDSNERYPWRFSGYRTERRKLAVGDYALMGDHDAPRAVIERKTFDNLLHDFAQVQLLHQQLAELGSFPNGALVIEAQYGDFLNRARVKH